MGPKEFRFGVGQEVTYVCNAKCKHTAKVYERWWNSMAWSNCYRLTIGDNEIIVMENEINSP